MDLATVLSVELSQIIGQLKFPLHTIRIDRSGPGLARNHGVQIAKGDIILFTDSDCIPDCNWIENMVRSVKNSGIAVGGHIEPHKDSNYFAKSANLIMSCWLGGFGSRWRFGGLLPGHRLRTGNAALKKTHFETVGMFNPQCGFYGEDTELSDKLSDIYSDPYYCKKRNCLP